MMLRARFFLTRARHLKRDERACAALATSAENRS
jgi:hypothetical protein